MTNYGRLAICGSFLARCRYPASPIARPHKSIPGSLKYIPTRPKGGESSNSKPTTRWWPMATARAAMEPPPARFPARRCGTTAIELTYGLTDRIEAAAYVDFAQPSGHGFWWAGDKLRLRGRLFDEDVLPVNLGWYVELEWHKTPQFDDADLELELKPIIEKDFGRVSLILNPVFEKPLYGRGHDQGLRVRLSQRRLLSLDALLLSRGRVLRRRWRPRRHSSAERAAALHLSCYLGRAPVSRRIQRRTGLRPHTRFRPRDREIQPRGGEIRRFAFRSFARRKLVFLAGLPANRRQERAN